MDSNYMKMHLSVDRYLRGTLTDDEKAAFEERLLWDNELIDEVDLAESLREGLQTVASEPVSEPARPGLRDWLSSFVLVPQYAAAASFLLAVVLMTAVFVSPITRDGSDSDIYAGRTEIVPLLATRGGDSQTINVDASDSIVLLVDFVGGYDEYRATLRQDGGAGPLWTKDGLTPTYPEALAVGMPGSALESGNYVLTLEGARIADAGTRSYENIQDIPFTVTTEQ